MYDISDTFFYAYNQYHICKYNLYYNNIN